MMADAGTWVVLGASSAAARAFARLVGGRGCAVVLAGRDIEDMERTAGDIRVRGAAAVRVVRFDALDPATDPALPAALEGLPGPVNLFLAFGIMPSQAEIDARPELVDAVMAANLSGAGRILLRLAPLLEAQGRGHVVVLGSVAGDRGRLKNYVYGASKAGLHAFLQGYRARMHRAGVHVLTVKPGFLDTAMTWAQGPLPLALAPDDFAVLVMRAVERRAEVAYVPWPWRWIMTIIRAVPERLFKRTNI